MALPLRRLAGLLVIAVSFGCPKAVDAPKVVVSDIGAGVQIGQVVRLDASGSTDPQGRDLTFAWQFDAIPIGSTAALNDAHSATPSFLADVDGDYVVQVVVSNAFVSAAAVSKKITVSRCGGRAPVFGAAAVSARDAARPTITGNFAVGATIVLASDVSDPDNSTADQVCAASQNQAISYAWKLIGQPAASTASLNNATASSPSFVADVAGTYTVRLVATDSTNRATPPFDQTFTVSTCGANAPTVATVAPVTEQLAVGKTIQMTAVPDDADNGAACQAVLGAPQTFSYRWSLPQLPNGSRASLNSAVAQNPSFMPDVDGDYVVRLVIDDSTGRSSDARDTLIRVPRCGNNAPVAAITSGTGGAAPASGFIGILLQFGETVQDLDQQAVGATPAACNPPIPQSFSLKWSIVALPAGSLAQLNNPTGTDPSFTPDVAGTYTVQLVATDQSGLSSAPVTQSVVVKACGMTPPSVTSMSTATPLVNAGTAVDVTALASDPDNSTGTSGCNLPAPQTFTYAWSLASKPAASAAFISNPSQDPTAGPATFTPDVADGTYQVQLVVTDSTGLKSAPAVLSISTNSCGTNAPVLASAAANLASPNPGTQVTLTATGADPDNAGGGKCSPDLAPQQGLSYRWTMTSRPSGSGAALAVSTAAANGSVATFTPDVIGPYQFSVVVTDSTGLSSAPSFVTVQTSQCGAFAPSITSAAATPALAPGFTEPRPTLDAVALGGAVTDADDACFGGTQPRTYAWTVASRPAGSSAVISSPTSLTGASFTPDVPGAYQFQLDVTDSLGLKAAPAYATVTASSCSLTAPSVAPIAAGSATQFVASTFPAPVVTDNNCLLSAATHTYAWSIVSAPAGSSATLSNPAVATPSFTPDKVGSYQFALTVTNGAGIASSPVFFNLAADTCGNASLGWSSIAVAQIVDPDLGNLTLPATPSTGAQVTVSAVANDPNTTCGTHRDPITYQWAIVAAPKGSHATLTSTTGSPAFVPDVPNGTYQLSVVATDALGNTSAAPDFITVTTTACGGNVPSVTVAPADLTGTASIFSMAPQTLSVTTLNADDACSTRFHIAPGSYTYAWSIASQPSNGNATLTSTTGATTSFEAFVPGLYSAHVVATAPTGVSSDPNQATSFVAINAKSCGSNAPVVISISTYASGTTNALSRPDVGQSVDLVANATDPDGAAACAVPGAAVTSYAWTAVSLPPSSNAPLTFSAATGTFPLTPDVAGTFRYSVVASDNTGLQSAPVEVSVDTASCGPVFAGIRAANGTGFLTPDSTNSVQSLQGSAVTFDLPPSVAHTGTGTGSVAVSGTPTGAFPVVVKIVLDPLLLTPTDFQLSVDGGATFGVATPIAASVAAGATGTTLAFSGSFVAGDTYVYATRTGGYLPNDVCVRSPSYAYSWSLARPAASQATLSTLSGASPSFTPDVSGIYQATLVVTDNAGLVSAPATLTVNATTCGLLTPTVAGLLATPAAPNAGDLVQLSASGITDGNTCGSVPVTPFMYSWSLISAPAGSSAKLSSQTSATPTFVADVANGDWQLALTVTDQLGMTSSPAFLKVTSTSCGAVPPTVALVAASGVGDFTATQALAVNGGTGLQLVHASDPAKNFASGAGTTLVPFYPSVPVQLAANVNPGADACAPSKTISYQWSIAAQPAGSTAQINNPGAASPSFTPDRPGTYDFQLVLRDQYGNASTNALAVDTVGGHPGVVGTCGTHAPSVVANVMGPIAPPAAGTPNEPLGIATQLDATGSQSPDDYRVSPYPAGCGLTRDLTYQWALTAAPASSVAQMSSPGLIDPSFTPDLPGVYTVQVTASDGTNAASRSLQVNGVGGFTSTPAATGAVLTSTAVDGAGNPVVAWWDNTAGAVAAAQCTSNCGTANPIWTSLGTIDSGLGPMAFGADDEPRPVSAISTSSGIWVAYYTGHQPGVPTATTIGAQPFCSLVLSRFNGGTTWSHQLVSSGGGCDASAFGVGTQSGRYVSLAASSTGIPAIGYWKQLTSTQTEAHFVACTDTTCSVLGADVAIFGASANSKYGRWVSLLIDPTDAVHVAWYFDDDIGTGNRGLVYSFSSSFSAPAFTFTSQFVPGMDYGRFASIASIPAGTPGNPSATRKLVIAYRDTTNKAARLASCTVPGNCTAWTSAQIPDAASADYGRDSSITVDPASGYPRLAYSDATNGVIRVLAGNGSLSFSKIAEVPASATPGLSIAFGAGTRLSYSNPANALKLFVGP